MIVIVSEKPLDGTLRFQWMFALYFLRWQSWFFFQFRKIMLKSFLMIFLRHQIYTLCDIYIEAYTLCNHTYRKSENPLMCCTRASKDFSIKKCFVYVQQKSNGIAQQWIFQYMCLNNIVGGTPINDEGGLYWKQLIFIIRFRQIIQSYL